jgi:hypothetical protein
MRSVVTSVAHTLARTHTHKNTCNTDAFSRFGNQKLYTLQALLHILQSLHSFELEHTLFIAIR